MEESNNQFSWLVESRPSKPRDTGLTMVIGDGPYFVGGMNNLTDLVEVAGEWVDWYKLTWGSLPFQPPSVLEEKLDYLESHNILAFTGGNFLEAAVVEEEGKRFLESVHAAGCPGVEVSSTAIEMSIEQKADLIKRAADRGLHVHAEIGEKASETTADAIDVRDTVREMDACLDAGADKLILETETIEQLLVDGDPDTMVADDDAMSQLTEIVETIGVEHIMFEVPLADYYDVMRMSWWFLDTFGRDVNLGNVNPAHVLLVEQQRRGIGPHAVP